MATIETRCREELKVIADGSFTDTSRVILGLDDIPAGADYFNNLYACGAKVYILAAEITNSDPTNGLYQFDVKVRLHYALAPDRSDTYENIGDFVATLWKAMSNVDTWEADGFIPPQDLGYKKVSDTTQKPIVGRYEGTFRFIAGLGCA